MLHPLDNLSESLTSMLLLAGWKPGVSRTNPAWWKLSAKRLDWARFNHCFERQFSRFPDHCARRIIDELYGIRLETFQINRFWALEFYPEIGMDEVDDIDQLGEILNECFIPIGETPSEAIVLLGATGKVFLTGLVAPGVFSMGQFNEAIPAIITGHDWHVVSFDTNDDPDGKFTLR